MSCFCLGRNFVKYSRGGIYAPFQYKDFFNTRFIRARRLWYQLFIVMEIPILVGRHPNIETTPANLHLHGPIPEKNQVINSFEAKCSILFPNVVKAVEIVLLIYFVFWCNAFVQITFELTTQHMLTSVSVILYLYLDSHQPENIFL